MIYLDAALARIKAFQENIMDANPETVYEETGNFIRNLDGIISNLETVQQLLEHAKTPAAATEDVE